MAAPSGPGAAAAAAPPPLPAPALSAPLLRALHDLLRGEGDFLGVSHFSAAGCMHMVVDFESAVTQAPAAVVGAAGSDARGNFMSRLLHAAYTQHSDWVAGCAASPSRRRMPDLSAMHMLPRRSGEAQRRFAAAVQAQFIAVQVAEHEFRLPVRAVLGSLPADHCQLVVHGLPPRFAVAGVTEALLRGAGYGAECGVAVLHERAGAAPTLDGTVSLVPVLDTVVAVVMVPPGCEGLPMLPRRLEGPGWQASLMVEDSVVPPGMLVLRRAVPLPSAHPAGPHAGVRPQMARVYASAGLGSVAAVASPLMEEPRAAPALPPGSRTGLGFPPASAALVVAPSPSKASRAQVEPMPPAVHPPAVPLGEPGFACACQWVQEAVDECTATAAQDVVQRARAAAPAAYAEAAHAATPSALPRAFRVALHAQAGAVFGEAQAAALAVLHADVEEALPAGEDELMGVEAGGSALAGVPPGPYRPPGVSGRSPARTPRVSPRSSSAPRRCSRFAAGGSSLDVPHGWVALRAASMRGDGGGSSRVQGGSGAARGRAQVPGRGAP